MKNIINLVKDLEEEKQLIIDSKISHVECVRNKDSSEENDFNFYIAVEKGKKLIYLNIDEKDLVNLKEKHREYVNREKENIENLIKSLRIRVGERIIKEIMEK